MQRYLLTLSLTLGLALSAQADTCSSKPYEIGALEGYDHLRFAPAQRDRLYLGGGYVANLDGADDDNGDGEPDYLVSPAWVSYQLNAYREGDAAPGWKRPSAWYRNKIFDVERTFFASEKPLDDSYRGVGHIYNRGHLAMRSDMNRISPEMGCNSHDFTNAIPQHADLNMGIWLGLENLISSLANQVATVWVSAGPIYNHNPRYGYKTIGDDGEVPIAIPSAVWKTVAWIDGGNLQYRAFIYPNEGAGGRNPNFKTGKCAKDKKYDHRKYLVSLGDIESQTGLTLFPEIPEQYRSAMLEFKHETMPEVDEQWRVGQCI